MKVTVAGRQQWLHSPPAIDLYIRRMLSLGGLPFIRTPAFATNSLPERIVSDFKGQVSRTPYI
jgi:hypothetical protein